MNGALELVRDVYLLLWNIKIPGTDFSFGALMVVIVLFEVALLIVGKSLAARKVVIDDGSNGRD